MKRQRMSYRKSKADFRKKGSPYAAHPKNTIVPSPVYRGGIRL